MHPETAVAHLISVTNDMEDEASLQKIAKQVNELHASLMSHAGEPAVASSSHDEFEEFALATLAPLLRDIHASQSPEIEAYARLRMQNLLIDAKFARGEFAAKDSQPVSTQEVSIPDVAAYAGSKLKAPDVYGT